MPIDLNTATTILLSAVIIVFGALLIREIIKDYKANKNGKI